MKVTTAFDGGQAILARLEQLAPAVKRAAERGALEKAAAPIRARAAELAPRSSRHSAHLADNIVIGAVNQNALDRAGRESETVIETGPSKKPGDFFYGFFDEFGTIHQAAQPYMRPAFDSQAPAALGILGQELWNAIRAAAGGGSSDPATRGSTFL
jgi:HK97 gp10 family phage protein